jgi:DNA gyrase subunit A
MRVYEIPEGSKTAKGRERSKNLVKYESDDKGKAFICTQDLKDQAISHNLIMVTKKRSGKENIFREIF